MALALATTAIAGQFSTFDRLSATEVARLARQVDRALLELYGCMNQSCLGADTSGSTGRVPFMKAEGATDADITRTSTAA